MKPQLNTSKKGNYLCWFFKNLRSIYKTNLQLVTEVDKPKTSCKYSEAKKVKQDPSVISNFRVSEL